MTRVMLSACKRAGLPQGRACFDYCPTKTANRGLCLCPCCANLRALWRLPLPIRRLCRVPPEARGANRDQNRFPLEARGANCDRGRSRTARGEAFQCAVANGFRAAPRYVALTERRWAFPRAASVAAPSAAGPAASPQAPRGSSAGATLPCDRDCYRSVALAEDSHRGRGSQARCCAAFRASRSAHWSEERRTEHQVRCLWGPAASARVRCYQAWEA